MKRLKLGVATTVADAAESIDQFIAYHLSIGFSKIYLFIDDNCAITYQKAKQYTNVTCFLRDDHLISLWKTTPIYADARKQRLIDAEVMVRQEMNFLIAYRAARTDNINWLIHIDLDELFFPNGCDLHEHFLSLQQNGYTCITYLNYEAILAEQPDEESMYFAKYFKVNFLRHKHWVFSKSQRSFIRERDWLKEKYFNYYQNGKSAVNTGYESITLHDVHSIVAPGARRMGRTHDPLILHFPCARKKDFIKKYKRLGQFSNDWMGQERAGQFIERVHLEARDLFSSADSDIDAFYTKHFILNQQQITELFEQNMAVEIDFHINVLTKTNSKNNLTLEQHWHSWIAENLLLGNSTDGIMSSLTQAGIAEPTAQQAIDDALKSPYIAGAQRLQNRLLKHDWVLNIHNRLNRLLPTQIERRHCLSREDFLRNYYAVSQPVIITGMMDDWPAMEKWSLDYFYENFKDREVEVQFGRNSDVYYEVNKASHKKRMLFGDYVNLIKNSEKTNDFYITATNNSLNSNALKELWDDIIQLPEYLDNTLGQQGFLWFGPAGTITPLHHDLTNNFMTQVVGSKRLFIIPSSEITNLYNDFHCFTNVDPRNVDLSRFPKMENVRILECLLNPGEVIFLPAGCWHFVEGLEISVTLSFTNFLWDNSFYTSYPSDHKF